MSAGEPGGLEQRLFGDGFEAFMQTSWQREPKLIDVFDNPVASMGLDEVEALISVACRPSRVRAIRESAGELSAEPCPTTHDRSEVDPLALFKLYADGWTINANSVDQADGRLSALAAQFSRLFDLHVNINLYLTPPGAQGFLPHVDGHDVFILPLAGEKSWETYDRPVELPLEHQSTPPLPDDAPSRVLSLSPGQALYLPRGWRHRAWSDSGGCAHLTIGLHAIRTIDVVSALVRAVAERDVRLRTNVPNSDVAALDRDALAELARVVAEFPDEIADDVVRHVRDHLYSRVLKESGFTPGGTLRAIDQLDAIDLDTRVRHRVGHAYVARRTDAEANLFVNNTTVSMPGWVQPALDYIAGTRAFIVRDLPGLSPPSALVLIRRLVREGMLQVTPHSIQTNNQRNPT